MQKKDREAELSRLSQNLQRLIQELDKTLEVVFARGPLVKGNVYELARKCGKPSCACQRGELHRSMVLSASESGKTRLRALPRDRVSEIRKKSQAYRRFRRARAQVSKIVEKMLAAIDAIEQLRREEL